MSHASAVSETSERLRWMVAKEMRGPADAGNALERIIRRHNLRDAAVRAVLYRSPADIYMSVYLSVAVAFEAEVSRWEKSFEHERAIARAKTGVGAALLRFADSLDGIADQVRGSADPGVKDGEAR